jgi:hypothetical protein
MSCMFWLCHFFFITQTTLLIPTTMNTSNPIPKIIKNCNVDGNITLGKLNYRRTVYLYNTTYLLHQLCTLFYTMFIKTEETNYFQYKYTFYVQV